MALANETSPEPTRGTELGHFFKKIRMRGEEKAHPRRDLIDAQSRGQRRLVIRQSIGNGEGNFLRGGATRLPHVVARNGDRIPRRESLRAVGEGVGYQPHRWAWREDVGATRRILLQDVVL